MREFQFLSAIQHRLAFDVTCGIDKRGYALSSVVKVIAPMLSGVSWMIAF
jgi:hypothetical protein